MRKTLSPLNNFEKSGVQVLIINREAFALVRTAAGTKERLFCLFNFSERNIAYTVPEWIRNGTKLLDSKEPEWQLKSGETTVHPQALENFETLSLLASSVVVYAG